MKKLYFLIALLVSFTSFGQDMVLTGAFDGPLTGGTPKLIEIYVINDIADLSTYGIGSANNGGGTDGEELTFSGAATAGSFIYVGYEGANAGSVNTYFGVTADYLSNAANNNGDDALELFSGGAVIDTFGDINTDGTGQPWEYLDGWAYRNNSTGPDGATFALGSWAFSGANAVDGCTTNTTCTSVFPIGTFTYSGTPCTASLGAVTFVCGSNTIGDNNDSVTIQISYTGLDATIASVTTTSAGTIGGDNPASVSDGTITISGLSEGDAWDVVLNGGNCDGNSTSGTVPADQCDPAPNTCFDISTGTELFELVTVTTNSSMNEWTNNAGTYSLNGFCGGGCQEQIEGWLIFGPLDMTAVTDLELAFTAVENFGTTDLVVAYTAAYPGCPTDATWTTAQTVTDAGAIEVDLSAATGTDVFIGIQYVDDGVDGYSDWDLSNVELQAFGACPTLGTRPASTCVVCELALGADSATCDANTAGVDPYTATLDFTGGATTVYAVSSDFGVIGGDDPNSVAAGTITVTGINEGQDVTISIMDQGGICNLQRTITSPTCSEPANCSNVGEVIFTEIMQNPSINGDPAGEYFELYNTTSTAFDMVGWVIKDDLDGAELHTIATSLIIPANGYVVIANGATPNGGLTPDYTYANDISLGNSTDGLILECNNVAIDQVIWDNGATFPDPSGASMELSLTALNATDNDTGSNWGTATSPYGDGDSGTPGAPNDFTLSVDQFSAIAFNVFPNPTATGIVNITSRSSEAISVQVFDIVGKQVISKTLNDNRLNVADLNSGLYVMKISQNNTTVTKKLVIK